MIIVKQEGKESGDLIIGNDVETIQRAINKARVEDKDVLVYPGTYVGSSSLVIPRGINLTGKGDGTVLNFPTMSGDVIKFSGIDDKNTEIKNLRVISSNPTTMRVTVDKVKIVGVKFEVVGIILSNSNDSEVTKCWFRGDGNPQAVLIDGGRNVSIDLCSVYVNSHTGIAIKNAEIVSITNSKVSGSKAKGIDLMGAKTVVITSSILDGQGVGIFIDSTSSNLSIAGNVIRAINNQGTSVTITPNGTTK